MGARLRGEAPDTKRATALLGEVGLNGLETSKPAQLSGGQRHRVALARALMEDAALVVLDEPFSALDTATRLAIQDLAHKLLAGCTVILITHDPLEVARMGDRAYLLSSNGSSEISLPSASTPRAYDADGTLACQAALMRQLTGVRAA